MGKEFHSRGKRGHSPLKVVIIGLSQSPGFLSELRESFLEIAGVSDFDLRHNALEDAQKQGIFVTDDYTELLERPDVDIILNLLADETVEAVIDQLKPDRARVINVDSSSFINVFLREAVMKRGLDSMVMDLSGFFAGLLDQDALVALILQRILEITGSGCRCMGETRRYA